MTLLLSLLIFLPKILCGFALVHWFWKELDFSSTVLKIATGFPVGLAVSSSLFFGALLVGISPNVYSIVEFWGFLIVAILIIQRFLTKIRTNWKFISLSWQVCFSMIILLSGSGILIYAFLLYSKMHPYGFEDAWSIWNFTARFIYRMNSPAILLNNQYYEPFHPDYPVGLGLNVAWGWFVLGRESTNVPIAIAFYVIISPVLLLWGGLKKWRGTLPALLATLVYLMNPNLKWSVGQMADGLIALYMLSALIMFYGYLRSSHPGLLLMAGFLAGFSAWIKNEGILFACIFILILGIMLWKHAVNWATIKWFALGSFLPLLVVTAFKLSVQTFSGLFNGTNSFTAQILDVQRWQMIGQVFLVNILHYGNWPVSFVLVLVVYMILVGFDNSERQHIWLFLIVLGQFVGYFAIYLVTPYDLPWHLSTSIDRVISHLFPMAFFWMFTALQSPQLATSGKKRQHLPELKSDEW